jgi:hypothetical protein
VSRRGLTARLDASGKRVLCGRCSTELARVWDGGLGERHRRIVFSLAWSLTDGIWRVTPRAEKAIAQGRRPMRRTIGTLVNPTTPTPDGWVAVHPARAECPACRAIQSLDPRQLRTDPTTDTTGRQMSVPIWRK